MFYKNSTVSVSYKGVKGLSQLPVFGLRFIMPTLADKYMYEGLSGETYPDRMEFTEEIKDKLIDKVNVYSDNRNLLEL